jgi:2-oxoglutarate dehydrogenase complex dehydrogenase (E1) component-like enzyme
VNHEHDEEFEETSTLFGGNAPFIEDQYETTLPTRPRQRRLAGVFRYAARRRAGPAAGAGRRIVHPAGQKPQTGRADVDAAAMHKQVLVLRLISKYRTVGFFQADLDPLQRAERPYIADLDVKTYGFTDADLDNDFDIGSYKGAPQGGSRMRLPRPDRGAAADLLPYVRCRVHVHIPTPRKSASSSNASSRCARAPATRRSFAATSSSA